MREEQHDDMKSVPNLVDRILEEESDSDSDDSDYHKYCTPTESKQIPAIINLLNVETVNEQDDSDAGSLPNLRLREEPDSDSSSDDDSDVHSLPGLQDRNRVDSDSDDSDNEDNTRRRTKYAVTQQWNEDVASISSCDTRDGEDSELDSINPNWMTTEEIGPVPIRRIRGGAIEDEIDDFYDNNDVMVEIVEEDEPYEIVQNTNTNNPVIEDEIIEELAEDESDVQPVMNPTTAHQLPDSTQPYVYNSLY